MDVHAVAHLGAPAEAVAHAVADLGTYPAWLTIVAAAEPAEAHAGDPGLAWHVVLEARLGPLVRRKRLRMVRTAASAEAVRFERREGDGRQHGSWVLEATVAAAGEGAPQGAATTLAMHLHYGGAGWVPLLDVVLREEALRAGARLDRLLAAPQG